MKTTKFDYYLAIDLESENFNRIEGGNYEDVMLSLKNTLNNLEDTTTYNTGKVLDSFDTSVIGLSEKSFVLLPNNKKDKSIIGFVVFPKVINQKIEMDIVARMINEDLEIISNELQ